MSLSVFERHTVGNARCTATGSDYESEECLAMICVNREIPMYPVTK
jgi:hypothetical protein